MDVNNECLFMFDVILLRLLGDQAMAASGEDDDSRLLGKYDSGCAR